MRFFIDAFYVYILPRTVCKKSLQSAPFHGRTIEIFSLCSLSEVVVPLYGMREVVIATITIAIRSNDYKIIFTIGNNYIVTWARKWKIREKLTTSVSVTVTQEVTEFHRRIMNWKMLPERQLAISEALSAHNVAWLARLLALIGHCVFYFEPPTVACSDALALRRRKPLSVATK